MQSLKMVDNRSDIQLINSIEEIVYLFENN